jgi:hypothetical protein
MRRRGDLGTQFAVIDSLTCGQWPFIGSVKMALCLQRHAQGNWLGARILDCRFTGLRAGRKTLMTKFTNTSDKSGEESRSAISRRSFLTRVGAASVAAAELSIPRYQATAETPRPTEPFIENEGLIVSRKQLLENQQVWSFAISPIPGYSLIHRQFRGDSGLAFEKRSTT